MRDWKFILWLIIVAILSVVAINFLVNLSDAADNLTVNATPTPTFTLAQMVTTPTPTPTAQLYYPPTPTPFPTIRIVPIMANNTAPNGSISYYVQQGATVYLGDTVDISGVMAGVLNLAYYGGYDEESGDQFLLDTPDRKIGYYRYYIDPFIFGNRTGKWYKWNGYVEKNANNLVFIVSAGKHPVNQSPILPQNTTNPKPVIVSPVTLRHVSDILVARGDPINIAFKNAKIWIFGKTFTYYDFKTTNNTIAINGSVTQGMEAGDYTLVAQQYNNNSANYNLRYNETNHQIEYFDPIDFQVKYIDLYGIAGSVALDKFRSIQKYTKDDFTEYSLTVANPYIEIISLDQRYMNDTTFAQIIRGYSNLAVGAPITVTVDKEKVSDNSAKYSVFQSVVKGSDQPGDMRWFEATAPLLWDNFVAGHHTITVDGGNATMYVDFNVYISPDHSFIPNNTIKYVGGNEFVPTPTPITVEKIVKQVVTQTILVPVTPSDEVVYTQQKIASEKTWWEGATRIASVIGGGVFLIGGIWYGVSVYRRVKD
jgi:hypothetical protein